MTRDVQDPLPFFVYGTLRRGQANYDLFKGKTIREELAIIDGMTLYTLGAFPMMLRGQSRVHGELVTIAAQDYWLMLYRLDFLEGYDPDRPHDQHLFYREAWWVHAANRTVLAWVYLGNLHRVAGSVHLVIPHGDWCEYHKESAYA